MSEQTLNIPQLLVFIAITFLAVRWYFSKPTSSASTSTTSGTRGATRAGPRINLAQVDQIAQMLPQLDRRDIAWDLQRNGGNVAATTERALSGRGLDRAPPSFTLPTPAAATPASRTASQPAKAAHPDLITRYNLANKVNTSTSGISGAEEETKSKTRAWGLNKDERQANLKRRREDMILAARRKMEEKAKS